MKHIFVNLTHTFSMYFNYHAKVKRLIKEGRAVGYEFLESYHNISPCLLIYFIGERPMPIRADHFDEYLKLLREFDIKSKSEEGSNARLFQ